MHELTILVELVDMVEQAMKENNINKINMVVVQVGQLSSIVPRYLKEYYPNACANSKLEGSSLKIEMIRANGLCHHCNKVFNIVKAKGKCPLCQADDWEMLSGQEFMLKEIRIGEEIPK